jgi:hypothetical protein
MIIRDKILYFNMCMKLVFVKIVNFLIFRLFQSETVISQNGIFRYTTNKKYTDNFAKSNSQPMRSFGCTRMNEQRHFACYWLTTRTGSYFYTCTLLLTDLYAKRNSCINTKTKLQ